MFPSMHEVRKLLSASDQEILDSCSTIAQGPTHWQIIEAAHGTSLEQGSVGFTFGTYSEEELEVSDGPRKQVTMLAAGLDEDRCSLKILLRHPESASVFIYRYDPELRTGILTDVNFINAANTLQAGSREVW